jgi:hypothetical protein
VIFLLRLRALPGVDGVRALRAALKVLLRCLSVEVEATNQEEASDGRRCEEA